MQVCKTESLSVPLLLPPSGRYYLQCYSCYITERKQPYFMQYFDYCVTSQALLQIKKIPARY